MRMALLGRRIVLRHDLVELPGIVGGVHIHKINRALDHLIGADGRPVQQISRTLNAEPGAVRAGGIEMEAAVGQQARQRPRPPQPLMKDHRSRAARESDDILRRRVGVRRQRENDGFGNIRRSIVYRHDGNQAAGSVGGKSDIPRQFNVVHAIAGSAADAIGHCNGISLLTETAHGEKRVLGPPIGAGRRNGWRPIRPRRRCNVQTGPDPGIAADNGNRICGHNAHHGRSVGRWRRTGQDGDVDRRGSSGYESARVEPQNTN